MQFSRPIGLLVVVGVVLTFLSISCHNPAPEPTPTEPALPPWFADGAEKGGGHVFYC
jgi:hypothetical protein